MTTPTPAVLIVGLLPAQVTMITREFHDQFDLRFWKDAHPRQLRHQSTRSDHVILMASKCSHVAQHLVQTKRRPVICRGGMTSLRQTLAGLAR